MAHGRTNREIAAALFLSEETVRTQTYADHKADAPFS
ncbi:MAG: LuxR C-terminal-related transcriptional regulator [Blastocatellia bacterium]